MLNGVSDTARNWIMIGSVAVACFGAGAGFMGWMDVPDNIQKNQRAILVIASNQGTLAEQLTIIRCQLDDLSNYQCNKLQRRLRRMLEDPESMGLEMRSEDEGDGP